MKPESFPSGTASASSSAVLPRMKVDELRHLEEEDSLSRPARLPLEPPLVPRDGTPEPPRVSVVDSGGWPVIMLPLPRDLPAPAWLVGVLLDLLLDGEVFILSKETTTFSPFTGGVVWFYS